ncbi:MAG: hypothetical protein ACOCNQ_02700, partial [Bacteroidales bacterium]
YRLAGSELSPGALPRGFKTKNAVFQGFYQKSLDNFTPRTKIKQTKSGEHRCSPLSRINILH